MALTGGLRAFDAGGIELPIAGGVAAASGRVRAHRPGDGARGYLAVGGGLVVDDVLGSAATDLRTGFGGIEGRALRAGDGLELGR